MNRSPRREWDASRSMCIDAADARKREQAVARRAELVREGRIDSGCRHARFDIEHECVNRDGQALRPWSTCHMEAFAQIREQQAIEREDAERHAEPLPPYVPPAGLPQYRRVQ